MPRVFERYSATYTGDGNAKTLTIGFKPSYLKLSNVTDRIEEEKFESMLDTEVLHTVAAGTRTLDTGTLVKFNSDKKTVLIAAGANVSAKVYHVIALP